MRNRLIICFVISFVLYKASAQRPADQTLEGLYKFAHEYFRSDPFKGQFSNFLKHLINDPDITDKAMDKKTDTSFFAFTGTYKTYNPFFFKPKRIEVILQETAIAFSDSAAAADTIFTYHLLAYLEDDKKGKDELMKEFEKIHRQTKRKFFDSGYKEIMKGNEITGAWHNYFVPFYSLAPATVAWSEIKDSHELVLDVTLRFKNSQNQTILPMPLYSPK